MRAAVWIRSAVAVLLAAACMSLCGCSPFSAVSDLLVPPQFSEENAELQTAFENAYGKNVQYKSPISGQYLSAFLIEDLDGEPGQEAMVFYTPDTADSTVHIALLDRTDVGWSAVQELEGGGSDVYSVLLNDMDGDGETEVILCFSTIENSRVMSIYSCTSKPMGLTKLSENNYYTAMLAVDLDNNGQTEIFSVLLTPEAGGQTAQARVLHKTENGITDLDKCYLDGKVTGYGSIMVQRTPTGCILYLDAYQGESGMLTELIVWDSASASMSTPLLDDSTRSNTQTVRYSRIRFRDLDGDGAPEIPCQTDFLPDSEIWQNGAKLDTQPYVTQWNAFRNGSLEPVCSSLVLSDGKCMFRIPDSWTDRFSTVQYADSDKWNFYEIDPQTHARIGYLFSVIFTTQTQWERDRSRLYVDYTPLLTAGEDMLLVYGINTDSTLALNEEMLRNAFEMLQ